MRVYLEVRIYIIWTNYTGVRSQLRETLIAERRQCDPVRVRLGDLMISIRDATKMYSDRDKIRFGHFFSILIDLTALQQNYARKHRFVLPSHTELITHCEVLKGNLHYPLQPGKR